MSSPKILANSRIIPIISEPLQIPGLEIGRQQPVQSQILHFFAVYLGNLGEHERLSKELDIAWLCWT